MDRSSPSPCLGLPHAAADALPLVVLPPDPTASETIVISTTGSTIVAQIPATLAPGVHDIVVVNPGGHSAALPEAWFVGQQVWLPHVRYD